MLFCIIKTNVNVMFLQNDGCRRRKLAMEWQLSFFFYFSQVTAFHLNCDVYIDVYVAPMKVVRLGTNKRQTHCKRSIVKYATCTLLTWSRSFAWYLNRSELPLCDIISTAFSFLNKMFGKISDRLPSNETFGRSLN